MIGFTNTSHGKAANRQMGQKIRVTGSLQSGLGRPDNSVEDRLQTFAFSGINGFYPGDSTLQVLFEHRVRFAILTLRAVALAVRKNSFQAVEIGPHDVNPPIHH